VLLLRRTGLFVLLLAGCGGSPEPGANPGMTSPDAGMEDPPAAPGTPRMLALGDSYTMGQNVPPEERWPVQLVAALKGRGIELAQPTIIARTGWTTSDLSAALDRVQPKGPYALVSLLIGVNNQYRGLTVEAYQPEFAALLGRAIQLAGGKSDRVIVVSIPDYGATPHGDGKDRAAIATALDRFNDANRRETEKAGAHYVEITVASRRARTEPDLVANDGLHPSGKMYAEWAAAVLPVAEKLLKAKN
jgi:lysophospholipase L1-like esterase